MLDVRGRRKFASALLPALRLARADARLWRGSVRADIPVAMTPIRIRPATPADAQTIADYNAAMALETEHKRLAPDTVRAGVARGIASPAEARYFVAEIDGAVVGQLMVTF